MKVTFKPSGIVYEAQEGIEKLPFETAEFLNAISDRLADYKNN